MSDIFQDFAKSINVNYVSDLQGAASYDDLVSFANNSGSINYPIDSWNDVFSYIFKKPFHFSDINEILSLRHKS